MSGAGDQRTRVRLSPAQHDLFIEMKQHGGLYIDKYKRYARTAKVLADKGLVVDDGEGWGSQIHYRVTEEGWAWTDE